MTLSIFPHVPWPSPCPLEKRLFRPVARVLACLCFRCRVVAGVSLVNIFLSFRFVSLTVQSFLVCSFFPSVAFARGDIQKGAAETDGRSVPPSISSGRFMLSGLTSKSSPFVVCSYDARRPRSGVLPASAQFPQHSSGPGRLPLSRALGSFVTDETAARAACASGLSVCLS